MYLSPRPLATLGSEHPQNQPQPSFAIGSFAYATKSMLDFSPTSGRGRRKTNAPLSEVAANESVCSRSLHRQRSHLRRKQTTCPALSSTERRRSHLNGRKTVDPSSC